MQLAPFVIPLQVVEDSITRQFGLNLFVLRIDLNHPHISGNKLFKLKYNLMEAEKEGASTLLTFGGAFSNHIAATAAAGQEYGFKTIGVIRGEEHSELNPTLQFALSCGMRLYYVSRSLYRNKQELLAYVNQVFAGERFYIIPEGGANPLGVKGCMEIVNYVNTDFDYICCACGTGTTVAGLAASLNDNQKALGFQVLKADGYIKKEVKHWLGGEYLKNNKSVESGWDINEDYHFGGYAKVTPELIDFVKYFKENNNISLDYVYTGKMMFGVYDLMKKGFFKNGETIVAVHTGGLQGNAGFSA